VPVGVWRVVSTCDVEKSVDNLPPVGGAAGCGLWWCGWGER
jgi:hypothetical protein